MYIIRGNVVQWWLLECRLTGVPWLSLKIIEGTFTDLVAQVCPLSELCTVWLK